MLNLKAPKSSPPPAQTIADIAAKAADLKALDARLLGEQLQLEKAKVIATKPRKAPDVTEIARLILAGEAPPIPPKPAGERLYDIMLQRAALQTALASLERELRTARVAAMGQAIEARKDEWAEIQRARAAAIKALRRANRLAAEFRQGMTRIGGELPSLPADFQGGPVFGEPVVGDRVYEYFRALGKAGILSQREIDNEK